MQIDINGQQWKSNNRTRAALLLKPDRPVGFVGYGVYIPRYRLPATRYPASGPAEGGGPVKEKAVPGLDEDVVTMSIEAARNALSRAEIPGEICARSGWARNRTLMR